jgi:RNA polymerase sigma factor (sigma-70 family)
MESRVNPHVSAAELAEAQRYALHYAAQKARPGTLLADEVSSAANFGVALALDSYQPGECAWRTWATNKIHWEVAEALRSGPGGERRKGEREFHTAYRLLRLDQVISRELTGGEDGDPHEWVADPGVNLEEDVLARLEVERVVKALEYLPRRERAVLVGFYLQERSQRDVGRDLGISESLVQLLRYRAVLRLQAMLRLPRQLPPRQSNSSADRDAQRLSGRKLSAGNRAPRQAAAPAG